jgi:phenylacetate-CoA ligase
VILKESLLNVSQIYDYLPLPAQEVLINWAGRRRNRLRFGKGYEEIYQAYLERSLATPGQIWSFQNSRLIAFLSVIFKCPPDEALEKFGKHKVMTKRDALDYFKADVLAGYPTLKRHTSGTTGSGLIFYVTQKSQQEQWAAWWRYRTWHGIPRDEWSCFFGAPKVVPLRQRKPPFWRKNRAGRQLIFSNYHLDKANAPYYLQELKASGHRWIHGFPSSIALLASYARDLGIQVPMKWVTTSAENLLPHHKKLIEGAFGVVPIQHYGQEEGVANISECPRRRLHVDEDFSNVEFFKSGYGENTYSIIGTNFTNPVFPLIRYDTGDLATLLPGDACDCGRPGRVVDSLDGRQSDYVVTKSGKFVGLLDHVFKDCVNVQKVQIRQDRPGFITILLVKGDAYGTKDEAGLREQIRYVLGNEMDYEIRYVEDIPGTGKRRLVVSSLNQGRMEKL